MNKILFLILLLSNYIFSQDQTLDNQQKSESRSNIIIGLNFMYANYAIGVEDDAHKGTFKGFNLNVKLYDDLSREFTIHLGSIYIYQKSVRFCEMVGNI